jgi:peptidoglycan/LPS O-acetylase OafA/YrhL
MRMQRIPTLDGWRALAITAVIVHHASMAFYAREADYWAQSITRVGAFGVDIFFGLSGLLITTLLLDEWEREGSVNLRAFYIRRAFRILPPCLILLLAITAAGLWRSPLEAASCFLFFRNYVPESLVSGYSAHLWSLAVEEHFYLLWPWILVWAGRKRGKHLALGIALLVGAWRIIWHNAGFGWLPEVSPHYRTDLRLDALLWGCLVAFLIADRRERDRFAHQMRFGAWVAAAGVVVLCVRYYSMMPSVPLAVLIPALLAGTAVHPRWKISRLIESLPFRWVGRISYSLYLWQQVFLAPGWEHPSHWWQQFPANLAATAVAAVVSYYILEKPMIRWGRSLASSTVPQPRQFVAA